MGGAMKGISKALVQLACCWTSSEVRDCHTSFAVLPERIVRQKNEIIVQRLIAMSFTTKIVNPSTLGRKDLPYPAKQAVQICGVGDPYSCRDAKRRYAQS
jgi:hypothetical protein